MTNLSVIETQNELAPLPFDKVNLSDYLICCGDDRKCMGVDKSIHIFGAGLNFPYQIMLLSLSEDPNIELPTFREVVGAITPVMIETGFHLSVHSDNETENSDQFNLNDPSVDSIGCGFAKLRQAISDGIVQNKKLITNVFRSLRPELITDEQDQSAIDSIFKAHQIIANGPSFRNSSGREVVKEAFRNGASATVVSGPHQANRGVYNLRKDTSIDTNRAIEEKRASYCHDGWATIEIAKQLQDMVPSDLRRLEMSDLIDAIGTMLALGVNPENIELRR